MIPDVMKRMFPFLEDGGKARPAPDDDEIGFPEEDDFPDEEDEDRAKVA